MIRRNHQQQTIKQTNVQVLSSLLPPPFHISTTPISFPAEFHAQTAVEAALIIHQKLKKLQKSSKDIRSIRIRTQEAALRIINKQGPLDNFANRE